MKVFIQQKKTGKFWSRQKTWTSDRAGAMEFKRTIDAVDFCKKSRIKNAELMIMFSGSETAVRVAALMRKVGQDKRVMSLIGSSLAFANCSEWLHGMRWMTEIGTVKMAGLCWLCSVISGTC